MKKIGKGKVDGEKSGCDCFRQESSRRDFLCRTSSLAFAALVAAGIQPKNFHLFPVNVVSADAQGAECSYPVPSSDGVTIDSNNQVILVRNASHIFAFSLACPHENAALRWRQQDGRFQCPRHQTKYQPDGTWMSGRNTRSMDRFAVRLEGQKLVVDLNKLYRSDQQKSEWQAAFVSATSHSTDGKLAQ